MSWDIVLTDLFFWVYSLGFQGIKPDLHAVAGGRLLNVDGKFKLSHCVITRVHVEQSGCDGGNRGQRREDD